MPLSGPTWQEFPALTPSFCSEFLQFVLAASYVVYVDGEAQVGYGSPSDTDSSGVVFQHIRYNPFKEEVEENGVNYHYVTMIRDPVSRFISEWLHVRRGATWKESRLHCDGRDASLQEVPFCFQQGSWTGVTFDEFLNCSSNLAFNRQTRMLANLSLSDCYRSNSTKTQSERDETMLG
ncbi:Heparan-sulfate 6-O-sulfotransferase 3-B, partial [Bulinus truncatus]